MDDALRVRGRERLGDLDGDAQGLLRAASALARSRAARVSPSRVLHDEEVDPVRGAPMSCSAQMCGCAESSDGPRLVGRSAPGRADRCERQARAP